MANTPPTPKIRSMPGQLYQLTNDDLIELRLRQQALAMHRAALIMMQKGYQLHVQDLLAKYGIEPEGDDSKYIWQINLDTGEIVKTRKAAQ